jgi:serine protease inhibitor
MIPAPRPRRQVPAGRRTLPVGRRTLLAAPPVLLAAPPAALAASALLSGCGGSAQAEDLRSDVEPATPPAPDTAHGRLAPFTARLLAACGGAGGDDEDKGGADEAGGDRSTAPANLVCSPASALIALAMVAQGARGSTLEQMQDVLGGSAEELADLAGTLRVALGAVGEKERADHEKKDPDPAVAQLVDAAWLQEDLDVEDDYLDALARGFDAGLHTADFGEAGAREKARTAMNDLASDATDGLIEELVPQNALTDGTRLVLLNALHLTAAWPEPLKKAGTRPFTLEDGSSADVDMLSGDADGWFEDDAVQATRLDGFGDEIALVLVRPADSIRAVLEHWAADDGAALADLLDGLEDSDDSLQLTLPPFELQTSLALDDLLEGMGMADVFDPGAADLSGITTAEELALTSVLQKSVISVDDEGMEAASATAAIAGVTSAPAAPKELVLDAPFLYLAIERSTRAALVVGWVGEPTA